MLFLHNSYGTPEIPNCGNLEGTDWMESLGRANTEQSMHFRETNLDPSVHFRKGNMDPSMNFRKANTDPSMNFRKANTDPSMNFRKANTEFLVPDLHPTLLIILLPSLFPLLIRHNYQFVTPQ